MIREQLLTLSDYDYQCSYSILESPMGVDNYIATLKLTPVTDGNRTFAEWWAEFDCAARPRRPALARHRPGRLPGGFDSLKTLICGADRLSAMSRVDRAPPSSMRRSSASGRSCATSTAMTAWHPVVAESAIENDEPSDQVGCVRNFRLKDGNHIREQLLALSDSDTSRPTASSTPRCRCSATSPPSSSSA